MHFQSFLEEYQENMKDDNICHYWDHFQLKIFRIIPVNISLLILKIGLFLRQGNYL